MRMNRIIAATLLVVLGISAALAQAKVQVDSPFQALQFLMGDWESSGETQLGSGQGGFSFQPDLNDRIVIRRNFAKYETGRAAGTRHDDLMVIYLEQPGKPQAIYFDSEGHVIRYTLSFPAENTVVFDSDVSQPGPRYRLSYALSGGLLNGKFEIALPGQTFKTFLEWKAQRTRQKSAQ